MKREIVIIKEFADKDNFAKRYKPGDELPGSFSEERIANLVALGLVKISSENDVTDIDLTGKAADVIALVNVFEDVEKLKQYAEMEKASEKSRSTVVKAIEERIANLVA